MEFKLEQLEYQQQASQSVISVIKGQGKNTLDGFQFKNTKKLDNNADLQEVTGNIIYKDYILEQIARPIRGKGFVKFKNDAVIYEGEQLYWLIDSQFRKKEALKKIGIKSLSLTFIDRVDNYIQPDGIIRKAFIEQYKKAHKVFYGREADNSQIEQAQGYYFARTGKGDFTDNESSMKTNKELYDLILKSKNIDQFAQFIVKNTDKIEPTPNKGIYDHILRDSEIEKSFAENLDNDAGIVCFPKLPDWYKIPLPGMKEGYNPDFGVVIKKIKIRADSESEYYFVIETKGTNSLGDRNALTENEIYKIKCAIKHFEALGIEAKVSCFAPVKEYEFFKNKTHGVNI